MALFGRTRDVNLVKTINRELLGDVITQQASFYKVRLEETTFNLYGEAAGGKFYDGPIIFNCLVERSDQEYPESDLGVDFDWSVIFKFLREDIINAGMDPEVGDVILYNGGYYQVDDIISNQYLNPGLSDFGGNLSYVVKAHYEPADKFGITKERF